MTRKITRREFMGALGAASTGLLVAACGSPAPAQPTSAPAKAAAPTAAPAAKSAPASSAPTAAPAAKTDGFQAQWDALVDAAKKEGKVVVQTPAGAGYREAIDAFAAAFPGVEAEHQPFPDAATYIPKIKAEREAGIYSIDVLATTVTPLLQILKPEGIIIPIKPLLIRPDVLDNNAWWGGIEKRWADNEKEFVFRHQISVTRPIYINTNLVQADAIKSVDDLLDPKWKGKIVSSDLVQGYIYTPSTVLRESKGEDFLRKLFVEQEPQIIRDRRQAIETLIRGSASIGFGLHPIILGDFRKDGLANHIENLDVPDIKYGGGEIAGMYKDSPHPKAGALFINWLLSKDGQTAWSNANKLNSARKDVAPVDPDDAPSDNLSVDPTDESWIPKTRATQEFLKTLASGG